MIRFTRKQLEEKGFKEFESKMSKDYPLRLLRKDGTIRETDAFTHSIPMENKDAFILEGNILRFFGLMLPTFEPCYDELNFIAEITRVAKEFRSDCEALGIKQ